LPALIEATPSGNDINPMVCRAILGIFKNQQNWGWDFFYQPRLPGVKKIRGQNIRIV
jgi:hypothetical protein